MQTAIVKTAMIRGVEAVPVSVECSVERGLSGFTILGLPDVWVLEARERVRCAILSAGFEFPRDAHITVNLGPATLKKRGTQFDLAIACAILAATRQVDPCLFESDPDLHSPLLVFGELMLDGTVVPNQCGFAAYARLADANGWCVMCASRQTATEHMAMRACHYVIETLADLHSPLDAGKSFVLTSPVHDCDFDWSGIKALAIDEAIREAIAYRSTLLIMTNKHGEIAHRIKHGVFLEGDLPDTECDECESIASVAGASITGMRPLRAPHHSASLATMIGGGNPIRPGEVTLAHNGVLYLEHAEMFPPSQLDGLRHTRDERQVRIARADGVVAMPADCAIIATAAPCPCGNYGNPDRECTCTSTQVLRYRERIETLGHGLFDRMVSF